MTQHRTISAFPNCQRCGEIAHSRSARFCGHCRAKLTETGAELPTWQRPAPAAYSRVGMSRIALSCPECGEPMRFGFRKVCRRCGPELVMIPRLLHPYHVRVYVKGPRAALAGLGVRLFWVVVILGALSLIGRALK